MKKIIILILLTISVFVLYQNSELVFGDSQTLSTEGNKGDIIINTGGGLGVFSACSDGQYSQASSGAATGWACSTIAGGGDLLSTNNLSELTNTSTARTNLGGVITTSTGLVVANFASPNLSLWTNDSNWIATSTGLGAANFTTTSISQWANDSGYVTSSAAGSGTVSTSSPTFANYFPFWNTNDGSALRGSSTLFVSGANLFTGGAFNATGTITQGGAAVLTTSTNLGIGNFATTSVGQWANNDLYVVSSTYWALTPNGDLGGTWALPSVDDDSHAHNGTTISALAVADFTSANISNWTNDSLYITIGAVSSTINGFSGVRFNLLGGEGVTSTISNGSTTYRLSINNGLVQTCSGTDKFSSVSSSGIMTCTTDQGGGAVIFKANGGAFLTTSTIGFTAGANITLTTSTDGTYTIAGTGGGSTPYYTPHNLHMLSGIWTNMPVISTEFLGGTIYRQKFNFASSTQLSLNAVVAVAGAAANTKLYLEYSTGTVTWFPVGSEAGVTSTPGVTIANTTGAKIGTFTNVTTSVKSLGEVWLRVMGQAGNATADPNFNSVQVYVR